MVLSTTAWSKWQRGVPKRFPFVQVFNGTSPFQQGTGPGIGLDICLGEVV